jgi:hypothetical protein
MDVCKDFLMLFMVRVSLETCGKTPDGAWSEDLITDIVPSNNLIVMGGESNFLFKYSDDVPERLVWVERKKWILEEMKGWSEAVITGTLSTIPQIHQCQQSRIRIT